MNLLILIYETNIYSVSLNDSFLTKKEKRKRETKKSWNFHHVCRPRLKNDTGGGKGWIVKQLPAQAFMTSVNFKKSIQDFVVQFK